MNPLILTYLASYWREGLIGLLAVALMGACVSRDHRIANGAVAKEQSRQADSVLRVVTPQLLHTDTVLVHDTVEVRRAVDRVITLRDTVLEHLSDTILVKQFVTRADSAAQACSDLLADCATFRKYASQVIDEQKIKINALSSVQKTVSCRTPSVVSLLGGFAAAVVLQRALK